MEDEKMSSAVFQIASLVAALAVLAADGAYLLLPLGKMKDLARLSHHGVTWFLLAAVRAFGP
jgi:hypothetical protein